MHETLQTLKGVNVQTLCTKRHTNRATNV